MWNADIIGILFSVYSSGILVPVVDCMFVCPSPPHSHVETLTHSVRIFGDRVFERQLDYECGVPMNLINAFTGIRESLFSRSAL